MVRFLLHHRLPLKDPSLGLVITSNRDATMADVMSLDNAEHMNEMTHLKDAEESKTQVEEMNGVKEEKETKKVGRTRKRERPQKSSDVGITEVDNMNDVGDLEDEVTEDGANLTDVALKQEVWTPSPETTPISEKVFDSSEQK